MKQIALWTLVLAGAFSLGFLAGRSPVHFKELFAKVEVPSTEMLVHRNNLPGMMYWHG